MTRRYNTQDTQSEPERKVHGLGVPHAARARQTPTPVDLAAGFQAELEVVTIALMESTP
jgi:hypothetical protein